MRKRCRGSAFLFAAARLVRSDLCARKTEMHALGITTLNLILNMHTWLKKVGVEPFQIYLGSSVEHGQNESLTGRH